MPRTISFALVASLQSVTVVPTRPATIGRLPLLEPISAAHVRCSTMPVSRQMAASGIAAVYLIDDRSTGRQISLAVAAERAVRQFSIMMADSVGTRGEAESVTVALTSDGRIARGERRAYTMGMPASLKDDRKSGLLPADTVKLFSIMKAGLSICAR